MPFPTVHLHTYMHTQLCIHIRWYRGNFPKRLRVDSVSHMYP